MKKPIRRNGHQHISALSEAVVALMALAVFTVTVVMIVSLREYFISSKVPPLLTVVEIPAPPRSTGRPPETVAPAYKPDFYSNTSIVSDIARIIGASPAVFAYAHGTAAAGDTMVVGMANRVGNVFPPNQITIFPDAGDLGRYSIISVPHPGDIETMVYDQIHDLLYFALTGNSDLELYSLDPHTYAVRPIVSTSTVDAGGKPAIVTDGTYIYGITNTDPSTVFKVRISDGALSYSSRGHIADGHSAAIGIYGSTTELYFGGDMSNSFEKDNADTLKPLGSFDVGLCTLTDDMPYIQTGPAGGNVYIGCEEAPYGYRVNTSDMTTTRFPLPGASYGLFIYNGDLYNCAQDGDIDVFPSLDLDTLIRYSITSSSTTPPIDTHGQSIEPNELFFSTTTDSLYFTAWWGIPGLFQISTSTPAPPL